MNADILHSGFDGLKFTIQTDIPASLRERLVAAKAEAIATNCDAIIEFGDMSLSVRRTGGSAFSAHTGEYGAEWYFLDPENRPANNPGITVDFRAFLLATGGLQAAQNLFHTCMAAFGIPYAQTQLRVTRVDYAIDFLAPWFEPDRASLVVPPGTRITEHTGITDTQTHATGASVTGLRAGAVANRQLVIYDKRAEVIAKGKLGWLTIWNDTRAKLGKPPITFKDRAQSQVWRFELRLGSKQLRNRFDMRSWGDVDAIIGDAFTDFCEHIHYCAPTNDTNRSRWPKHELWDAVTTTISQDLHKHRSGVIPQNVKDASRTEHMRMLDRQILGLFISRAAASNVSGEDFDAFMDQHTAALSRASQDHPVPINDRLGKAKGRYRFR